MDVDDDKNQCAEDRLDEVPYRPFIWREDSDVASAAKRNPKLHTSIALPAMKHPSVVDGKSPSAMGGFELSFSHRGRRHGRNQIRLRLRSKRIRLHRHRRVKRLERVQESIDALPPPEQRTKEERKFGLNLLKKRDRILRRMSEQDEEMENDVDEGRLHEVECFPPSIGPAAAAASQPKGLSWRRNRRNRKPLAPIPEDPILAAGLASLQQSLGNLGLSAEKKDNQEPIAEDQKPPPSGSSCWFGNNGGGTNVESNATAQQQQQQQQPGANLNWTSFAASTPKAPQTQPSGWIMGQSKGFWGGTNSKVAPAQSSSSTPSDSSNSSAWSVN